MLPQIANDFISDECEYECDDGQHVFGSSSICDEVADCTDGSDEENCGILITTHSCRPYNKLYTHCPAFEFLYITVFIKGVHLEC